MRSHHVERDHATLIRQVLDRLYDDPGDRVRATSLIGQYQGIETDRVRLGILKASRGDLGQIERLLQLAKRDWRDLLVEAEYPLSFRKSSLQESDPQRYDKLLEREQREYDEWLTKVLAD